MASFKSSALFLLNVLLLSFSTSEARDFLVGGSADAWKVPTSTKDSLNLWAEATRFQVGDNLAWKYDAGKDSVLQVTREGYLNCNTSSPVAAHRDGATVVELGRAGAYYFISGAEGACQKGQKLIVVVMSERHSLRGLSPAPSPAELAEGPALAPTSAAAAVVAKGVFLGALVAVGTLL